MKNNQKRREEGASKTGGRGRKRKRGKGKEGKKGKERRRKREEGKRREEKRREGELCAIIRASAFQFRLVHHAHDIQCIMLMTFNVKKY